MGGFEKNKKVFRVITIIIFSTVAAFLLYEINVEADALRANIPYRCLH